MSSINPSMAFLRASSSSVLNRLSEMTTSMSALQFQKKSRDGKIFQKINVLHKLPSSIDFLQVTSISIGGGFRQPWFLTAVFPTHIIQSGSEKIWLLMQFLNFFWEAYSKAMIISVIVCSFPKMVILTIIQRGPLKKQVKNLQRYSNFPAFRAMNRLEIWYCSVFVYTTLDFPRFFSAESGPSKVREIQNSENKKCTISEF